MMKIFKTYALAGLCWLVFFALACEDDEPSGPTYMLRELSGSNLTGLQSEPLAEPVRVGLFDDQGRPVPAVDINISVTKGGGSLVSNSATTDANGEIAIEWTMGEEPDQELSIKLVDDTNVNLRLSARTTYKYRPPENRDDGWEIGSISVLSEENQAFMATGIDELRHGRYPETHSMLIIHNRKLVLESYFPGVNSSGTMIDWGIDTPHEIQSASKSFRSMLIGIAIDKGYIEGVDRSLFSFFPQYGYLNDEEAKGRITLEHVLTMSSGLSWIEWAAPFSSPSNNLGQMYAKPSTEWLPYVLSRPMQFEPGSTFVYNTGASLMLDDIVAGSINTTLAEFTKTHYSDLVEGGTSNNPYAATMTPRDMAKLGYLYLYDGYWKDNQVISQEWIERSVTPAFYQISSSQGDYGYQWWSRSFSGGKYHCYFASGNGGQFIFVFKDLDLVVVSTGGNFGSASQVDIMAWIERYVLSSFDPE
jgi:CubicO group peptidase (beta-lactamase class C family)